MPRGVQRAVSMPSLGGQLIGRARRRLLLHFRRRMYFLIREAISHSSRGRLIGQRGEMLKSTEVLTRSPFLVRSLRKL